MKKISIFFAVSVAFASCDDKGASPGNTLKKDSATAPAIKFAYVKEMPGDWEWGSNENTANVLLSLKAFENNNIEECMKYFGDSVTVQFDRLDKKMSNDSLAALFRSDWANRKKLTVKMDDWESVISTDKEAEYVSLWYKEILEDKNGKIDSVEVMNDLKMKNGKIIVLNEKTRHYQANP